MDSDQFRRIGKEMVDYIANYIETIHERRVTPGVEPGYLRKRLPYEPPTHPEDWADIMKDVEDAIMPGVSKHITPSTFCFVITHILGNFGGYFESNWLVV